MVSAVIWLSSMRTVVAFSAASTFSSTPAIRAATSLRTAPAFFSTMPLFVSVNVLAAVSRRSWSFVNTSVVDCFAASAKRLAARRFIARKVLAPPIAEFAEEIDASRVVRAVPSSSAGKSSFSRGASASTTFDTVSSAAFTRCCASSLIVRTCAFSAISFMEVTALSKASCDACKRGRNFSISSFAGPERVDNSMCFATLLRVAAASAAAVSLALRSFSVGADAAPNSSAAFVTTEAFASAASSFVVTLSTAFFAAMRVSTPAAIFLYLVTSDWAWLSRVWNLMSSELTALDTSLPFASICRAVMNLRASVRAALASTSAFWVATAAAFISAAESSKNFALSSRGLAASAMVFVSSSAFATSLSDSCITAFFFLAAVEVFNSLSRSV
mmetsp:Transcript_63313/g.176124  ORF Transcript_63313/g.176124 Transcript_63313/m.176124 type:complete len:387 (-) Transcript_63313:1930-3090(-)